MPFVYIVSTYKSWIFINNNIYYVVLACHYGHFCKTVGDWSRVYPAYHEYISGAVTAFFVATLQDYKPSIKYIENPDLIPLTLLQYNHTGTLN